MGNDLTDLRLEFELLRRELAAMRVKILALEAENAVLKSENAVLKSDNAVLRRRLGLTSVTSSLPPSLDSLFAKPSKPVSLREKSGKTSGGQVGGKGETLKMSATPDDIKPHKPVQCEQCGAAFTGEAVVETVEKRQVFDIPPPKMIITEHQAFTLRCSCCNATTKGVFPQNVTAPVQYGARTAALVAYLSNYQLVPFQRIQDFMKDMFQTSLCEATVEKMLEATSAALTPDYAAIKQAVHAAPVKHLDETGFRIGGKLHWLHVISTKTDTFLWQNPKRGASCEVTSGIVVHDFWKPYFKLTGVQHALCNAHQVRELKGLIEFEEETWAKAMKRLLITAFRLVERAKRREKTQISDKISVILIKTYEKIVAQGLAFHHTLLPLEKKKGVKHTRPKRRRGHNFLLRLKENSQETLRFIHEFSVPFTNNEAERDVRMAKVKQKISGGFRTEKGAEIFVKTRSVINSCRKKGNNVLKTITDAINNYSFKIASAL